MTANRLELEIEALGAGGDGVARTPAGALYVPYTLPGERVLAELGQRRQGGQAARPLEILRPAPERVPPACRHFGVCGGCALQHLAPAPYLEWKRRRVVTALAQRGLGEVAVAACVATPPASRRRVRLRARAGKDGTRLGLNRRRSHEIVALEECPVLHPALVALLPPLRALLGAVLPAGTAVDVQLTACEGGIDLWIAAPVPLDLALHERLSEFAEAHDLARLSWDDPPEAVLRRRAAAVRFGPALVEPPPSAFLQAGAAAEAAIVAEVRAGVGRAARVVDLFAGAGTLSLPLAAGARVTAVDADAGALAALGQAARATVGLKPVTVTRRDLMRRPLAAAELDAFNVAVFDPPRAGARAQAEMLAASRVASVVAVSCNPASFARDARILVDGGYRLEGVSPIDQFLWSPEVELVARFRRGREAG